MALATVIGQQPDANALRLIKSTSRDARGSEGDDRALTLAALIGQVKWIRRSG